MKNACSQYCSDAHPEETLIKDSNSEHKDKYKNPFSISREFGKVLSRK